MKQIFFWSNIHVQNNSHTKTAYQRRFTLYQSVIILYIFVLSFRDESIRKNVLRIFKIFEERNIYESDFCEKLTASAGMYYSVVLPVG